MMKTTLKRIVALTLIVISILCLSACGSNKEWTGKHTVVMEIRDYGKVTMQINCDAAPQTGSNFLNLCKKGFYDRLTVYRAIDGFAIYCGDPNGNGTGSSGSTIYGEFNSNGYNNMLSNTRCAIGMARGTNYNSASCQFYILTEDQTWLDGDFAIFGLVTSGMEVVDQIASEVQILSNDGYIADDNQPVITSIKVIE